MGKGRTDQEIIPFPGNRLPITDYLRESRRKPMTHGLVEIDVSQPRQHIREHKARTGETLSFTGFIVACLARAVDENKTMHAYRKGRNRLVIFDDVDVCVLVEHEIGDQKIAAPHVIRAANKKTYREIHEEIRAAQAGGAEGARAWKHIRWYPLLPAFIRRLYWRILLGRPRLMKRVSGTVSVTAIGMFGQGGGWAIPLSGYTLTLTIGSIAQKPGVVDGQITLREYLSLTISVDHDIIDGAVAARFSQRLRELIESGYGFGD